MKKIILTLAILIPLSIFAAATKTYGVKYNGETQKNEIFKLS